MPELTAQSGAPLRISDFYVPRAKQKLFHESTAPYRGQIGGFGSGKTRALLMEAIRHCLTIPGCNALIIRRTHKDLNKTIVNLLLNPSEAGLGIDLETLCGRKSPYNHTDHVCYFQHAGGVTSKLFFGYCDEAKDVNQYLSTEYVFIGIEEAGEFPLSVFTALCGRNRCPVKFDVFGRAVRSSVALATNPMGIGYGWIKKLFVEKKPAGGMSNYNPDDYFMVHSTLFDNPTYASDTAYIAKLEALPEAERQKKLFGNLESMEGIYYSNFDPNPLTLGSHVVAHNRIQFHPWHPRWIGFDWGFAPEQSGGHALAIIFFAKADVERPGGVTKTVNVAYDELVLYGKTEAQIVEEIRKKMSPGQQLTNIFLSHEQFAARSASRTVALQLGDELIKHNLPRPTQSDTDRKGGWKLGYNLFESDDLIISDNCPQLISALQVLTRDPEDIEDILKVDSVEDDLADAFRYGLKGYLSPGSKPMELQHEEYLHTAKNNTQRFMMDQKWQAEHKYDDQLTIPVPKRRLF
jgi:hypothetical protein